MKSSSRSDSPNPRKLIPGVDTWAQEIHSSSLGSLPKEKKVTSAEASAVLGTRHLRKACLSKEHSQENFFVHKEERHREDVYPLHVEHRDLVHRESSRERLHRRHFLSREHLPSKRETQTRRRGDLLEIRRGTTRPPPRRETSSLSDMERKESIEYLDYFVYRPYPPRRETHYIE
jgi:hypothetical protein